MTNGASTKKIITGAIIFVIFVIILITAFSFYSSNKQKKLQKEKEERAAQIKTKDFLDAFSKINWKSMVAGNCNIDNKGIRENKFSWINQEDSPELMDGYNLNIIFTENNSSSCCGDFEKIQEKIKYNFLSGEFSKNAKNENLENYIYAFENYGFKCVYGYRNIENKKNFCELGIICGRINQVFTNSDYQKIYNVFTQEPYKKLYQMVVLDKFTETLDGKFARGRVGYPFYLNEEKTFIARSNKEGGWFSLDNPEEERKINNCNFLLDEKVPPSIADPTCKTEEGETAEYEKLYSERYK